MAFNLAAHVYTVLPGVHVVTARQVLGDLGEPIRFKRYWGKVVFGRRPTGPEQVDIICRIIDRITTP